jgi:site-specific DNA-methyltransferase (adenine-specific)
VDCTENDEITNGTEGDKIVMYEQPDLYNADCMEAMKEFPDKFFDIAIVDPPYRDETENQPTKDMRNNGFISTFGGKPTEEYFEELRRVSKEQIIWGANNFQLPPYKGFIVWEKISISENFTMSMAEIASISEGLGTTSKIFRCRPQGEKDEQRIHPTQKPVNLYLWVLGKYAKKGNRILDTHAGSASSLIACHRVGLDAWGFEIDKNYYQKAKNRLTLAKMQISIFDMINE